MEPIAEKSDGVQARGLDERSSWGQSMALFLAEGCSPKFGRRMVVPALTEGCSVRFGAVPGCQALQQPPAEGTSRQGSAGQSSLGSANAPAACALEVNPKQAKSRSIGKERRPHRSSLGEGFSTHQGFSSSAGPNHPVTPFLSRCLFGFSAVYVYVNPAMFFRCARVHFLLGRQLWPVT